MKLYDKMQHAICQWHTFSVFYRWIQDTNQSKIGLKELKIGFKKVSKIKDGFGLEIVLKPNILIETRFYQCSQTVYFKLPNEKKIPFNDLYPALCYLNTDAFHDV